MKILLLGFGKTGKDLFYFLKHNNEVAIYDDNPLGNGYNYYSYNRLKKELPRFDYIIRSPGISCKHKAYKLSNQLTNHLVSEIEFLYPYIRDNKKIFVTGSNGKTTLVMMLKHILELKYNVFALGNIGNSLASNIKNIKKDDLLIFELSSFQLEDTYSLEGDYGIITNLTRNHLDSVYNKEYYFASKLKIMDFSKNIYIGKSVKKYANNVNYSIIDRIKAPRLMYLNELNQLHFNVCYDICIKEGIKEEEIINRMQLFKFPPYRNELVYKYKNFTFINDSKSTSISATNACIKQYENKNRIIILGGINKSESFKKVKTKEGDIIIGIGKSRYDVFRKLHGITFDTIKKALKYIKNLKKEYYVIFSPGCSSFDQFDSYEQRGEMFNYYIKSFFS